jgi:general secretion pathway protein D
MAQDNKEASVSIVNQIPILKSTIQGGSGTSRDVIQNIERMDVGIKLKITPHVIPNGQVRMELNPSIEAVVDAGPSGQYTPTTARREVSTVVTVPDGETIVIAGLTREDKIKVVHKIPILGSIPLIGWLFRHTVDSTEKTNLLIFVTPRVMKNPAGALQLRQDLQKRTGLQFEDEPKK